MAAIAYVRGHEVYFNEDTNVWLYSDSHGPIREDRSCVKCGNAPTKEGYDACIGEIEGVGSACCGHGVVEPYIVLKGELYESYTPD